MPSLRKRANLMPKIQKIEKPDGSIFESSEFSLQIKELSSSKKVSLFAIAIGLKNGPNKIERDLFEYRQKRMGFGIIVLDSLMNFFSVRFQIVLSFNRQ
jgi:hypothetical protein